jgi:hypothetical protein
MNFTQYRGSGKWGGGGILLEKQRYSNRKRFRDPSEGGPLGAGRNLCDFIHDYLRTNTLFEECYFILMGRIYKQEQERRSLESLSVEKPIRHHSG